MTGKYHLLNMVAILFLGLIVACGDDDEVTTRSPTPSPTAAAALVAPTRLSPSAKEALIAFAGEHGGITEDWEQFHTDDDQWREQLVACNASTLQRTLRRFAGDFVATAETARALPRPFNLGHQSDRLIGAAEREERALRELRDHWRPDSQALFEALEGTRSAAAAVQDEVQDTLLDLRERASPASRDMLSSFSQALSRLNEEWDAYHRSYDALWAGKARLTTSETTARLSELVVQFGTVSALARAVPADSLTGPVAEVLARAAEQEDLALRRLRDAFDQKANEEGLTAPTRPSFRELDDQLVRTNTSRRDAVEKLGEVAERLSSSSQDLLSSFSLALAGLDQNWDIFDVSYNALWSEKEQLTTAQTTARLSELVVEFGTLVVRIRDLPSGTLTSPVADILLQAVEEEDGALRRLRDTFDLADDGGEGPVRPRPGFHDLDDQLVRTSTTRRDAAARLAEIAEDLTSESRTLVSSFSLELSALDDEWDAFDLSYNALWSEKGRLTASETTARLGELVVQFGGVVARIRALPTSRLTAPVAEILARAAAAEDLALRNVRNALDQTTGRPDAAQSAAPAELAPSAPARVSPGFEELDGQVVSTNAMRRSALEKLAEIVETSSLEREQALEEFSNEYAALRQEWADFEEGYDAWRRTEGGCDRSAVEARLGQFVVVFGGIGRRVRSLPRLTVLQPLGEVLIEAAERQDEALRSLRNGWRPFDTEVYGVFERQRSASGKLRRQVDSGLNQLLTQHDVSP